MKSLILRLLILITLFIPPLVLTLIWCTLDFQLGHISSNIEIKSLIFKLGDVNAVKVAADKNYQENKKDQYLYPEQSSSTHSTDIDFKKTFSEKILEKLGIFSFFPLYTACLSNKNQIIFNSGGVTQTFISTSTLVGSISIYQEGGYNFYAPVGQTQCINVNINKLKEQPGRIEVVYPLIIQVTPEEYKKYLNHEVYSASTLPLVVETTQSTLLISVNVFGIFLAYFVLLLTWSIVFFQFEKIIIFVISLFKKKG